MTVRRFFKEIVTSVFVLIPTSAVIGIVVWFFCELLLNLKLGGFMSIWKWTYVVSATLWIVLQVIHFIYSMLRMFGFSKRIGAKFVDVEEAIWVFGLHKKYPGFFLWDLDQFTIELKEYRSAKTVADTLYNIIKNW